MGGKYHIRTNEKRDFGDTTDYYTNSFIELIKLMIAKQGKIIFIVRQFETEKGKTK